MPPQRRVPRRRAPRPVPGSSTSAARVPSPPDAAQRRCIGVGGTRSADDRVVVIGAGFGGMAAALRLRAAGFNVEVYEHRAQAGGRAGVYERDGYTFDAGPTVITAPFLLDELWELFGERRSDAIELQLLDPWYRIAFADGRHFDYGDTPERTLLQRVVEFAPADAEGYQRMVARAREIHAVGFTELGSVPFHCAATMLRVLPKMIGLRSDRSVYRFVSGYLKDEALRKVFSFQPLLVGGNPFTTTSIYALIQHLEREDGILFARGGTGALVRAMVELMRRQGIALHLGKGVRQLAVEACRGGARTTGVILDDGTLVPARNVVANADAPALYRRLVPERWRRKWTNARVKKLKFSMGLFVLYLGVKRQYPELAHHTIVLGKRYKELLENIFERQVLDEDISLYLHAPTRSDESLAPPGCENLYVLVPVPNLKGRDGAAPIDWDIAGPQLEALVIRRLEESLCPGLSDALQVKFYVTPRFFEEELRTEYGSGFSLQPTLTQSAWFRFHNRSEDIRGLYLVGAGTHPGAGVPGVLCSAKVLEHFFPEMRAASSISA